MDLDDHESEAYAAESREPEILIGTIVPAAIASIFVLGRFYSRAFLTRSLGLDDALILFAWVTAIALSAINCSFIKFGAGHHQSLQSLDDTVMTERLSYGSRMLYQLALGVTKFGLCTFYLRVFQDRKSKLYIYIFIAFIFVYTVPIQVYLIVSCRPGIIMDFTSACVRNTPDVYISALGNILTDIMLMIFAIPRICSLNMAKKQKIALLTVVCLGVLVIVAAIVRLVNALNFNQIPDRSWEVNSITTWSAIEVYTGLFCVSAPAIRPLIRKITPGFISSTLDSPADNAPRQHGTATQNSRSRNPNDTLELDSQAELHPGGAQGTPQRPDTIWSGDEANNNKIWHGHDGNTNATHWDDSDSEETVLGGIARTMSVTVVNMRRGGSNHSPQTGSSAVTFETV